MYRLRLLPLLPLLSSVLACATGVRPEPAPQSCVPGDQKACACANGLEGVQVCADDGSRYDACMGCSSTPGGTGGAANPGGVGGAPGTGGRGTGGATDAGALDGSDAADGATALDAPPDGSNSDSGDTGSSDTGAPDLAATVDGPAPSPDAAGVGGSSGDAGLGGRDGGGPDSGPPVGVTITPGPTGLVLGTSNALMVQGPWYAFGDGIGGDGTVATGICEARGGHPVSACSVISTPPPGPFTNVGGRMCTSGTAAIVIAGANALPDYANITGAGIGLDLNNAGGVAPVRGVFNALAKGVTGLSFDLEVVTLPGLRVELPTPATDGTAAGAAYWGGNAVFANSPIVAGTNVLHWSDVRIPGAAPATFDPTMIESVLFHVPTTVAAIGPYSFCVSNLKLLTQ